MRDERNDLIRVGDALDAITDWLCEEELRHNIEPNRRVNKFFAKVMLENVPRADHKTEPSNSEKPNDCDYAENSSGDVWECSCYQTTICEHQKEDFNPDGTINIVECKIEPQTECTTCEHYATEDCENGCVGYEKAVPQKERSE